MEHRQNSAVFRWVVVGIGVCLFLVGCRDKSVNRVNQERDDYADAKYDQAISDYTKAIEMNPHEAKLYYNRGVAYYGKRWFDQAISDYGKAIEIDPDCASAYNNRAVGGMKNCSDY
ncbi:MAG: tetratricopeptide repeat protein [Desulfobacteraceae bacterium]|nr:tetratricopeptide repeat protein [Desulfobacteraceae bacterium]